MKLKAETEKKVFQRRRKKHEKEINQKRIN